MAVEKFSEYIPRIRDLLPENSEGLTIKNISEMLGMNRNSAAKSLQLLQMQSRVTLRHIGPARLYCLARKLPADAVLKMSIDEINTLPPDEVAMKPDIAAQGESPVFISRHRVFSGEIKTVEVYSSPITMGGRTLIFSIIHEISGRAVENDAAGSRAVEEI